MPKDHSNPYANRWYKMYKPTTMATATAAVLNIGDPACTDLASLTEEVLTDVNIPFMDSVAASIYE